MKSFVFWLTTATALGTVLAMILHPSPIEVMIVWIVVNALYYGWRTNRRTVATGAH
jgi:hypothetical protein